MILIDLVLALAAIAGFGTFLWVIISTVPEPSLIAVAGVGLFMALIDFLREIAKSVRSRRGGGAPAEEER